MAGYRGEWCADLDGYPLASAIRISVELKLSLKAAYIYLEPFSLPDACKIFVFWLIKHVY
ncbi:hypothetical protein CSR02_14915 [Acetobacter pomorum]|uniref:Uncharacterized protein n=1 Tax=Acetobacter pomorum TaxID=65959 RepID=A0A2G4R8I0_9PROT|nr:hypothetical protein CSR02_14915 [Acetobacter pomorum]